MNAVRIGVAGPSDLGPEAVAALARLHAQSLPGSMFSRLGLRALRSLYGHLARSPDELMVLAWQGSALVGASIVSLAPATLLRRLILRSGFGVHLALGAHRLPWGKLLANTAPEAALPELVFLFVDPGLRGGGTGAALVRATEAACSTRGVHRLAVKTEDRPGNAAIRFYERLGYERAGRVIQYGETFVAFTRAVGAPAMPAM